MPLTELLSLTAATLTVTALLIPRRTDIKQHAAYYRDGITGIKHTPALLTITITALYAAKQLAADLPILKTGLLERNVLLPRIQSTPTTTTTTPETTTTAATHTANALPIIELVLGGVLLTGLIAVFLVYNWDEEQWGRETYWHVAGWAVTHLIMGIPLYAVAAIFAGGVYLKHMNESIGVKEAFTAHVTANTVLASIVVIAVLL